MSLFIQNVWNRQMHRGKNRLVVRSGAGRMGEWGVMLMVLGGHCFLFFGIALAVNRKEN